jgi:predicted TIM-barrel fold metal-dependent hydrolase
MDDPHFEPYWEELIDLGIPHIFIIGFEPKAKYLASLEGLERVLKKYPDLKGVIGHLGGNVRHPQNPNWTDTPKELLNILKLPNAYFEVGYVLAYENWNVWKENYEYPYPLHKKIIKTVYEEIGAERLLWGSDMPNIYRTCTYQQCLDLVRLHCDFLSEEQKALVLGGNAAKLFEIE